MIAQGKCSVLIAPDISRDDIYIYAFAGPKVAKVWSGPYNYCIDPKNSFVFRGADAGPNCTSGGRLYGLRYVQTSGYESFSFDLAD